MRRLLRFSSLVAIVAMGCIEPVSSPSDAEAESTTDSTPSPGPDAAVDATALDSEADAAGEDSASDDAADTATSTTDTGAEDSGCTNPWALPDAGPLPAVACEVCGPLDAELCPLMTASKCCGSGPSSCRYSAVCFDGFGAVAVGAATYDAAYREACVASLRSYASACGGDPLADLRAHEPCAKMLRGKKAPGDSCSPGADEACDATGGLAATCTYYALGSSKCVLHDIVGEGEACTLPSSSDNVRRYCDYGLHCEADADGGSPTCVAGASASCSSTSPCHAEQSCVGGHCIDKSVISAKPHGRYIAAWGCAL